MHAPSERQIRRELAVEVSMLDSNHAGRPATLDLSIGLGRFRWFDPMSDVNAHFPNARWSKNKELHPFKKVLYVPDLVELLPGLHIPGYIDRDDITGHHEVRVMMDAWHFDGRSEREVWDALADLCRRLGAGELSLPVAEPIAWRSGRATIVLSTTDSPDWREASLWIQNAEAS